MKRIAVMTWKFHNYGTALQAYALNHFLNTLPNIKCELIDYELEKCNLDIPPDYSICNFLKRVSNRLILNYRDIVLHIESNNWKCEIAEKQKKFSEFIKQIPQTKHYNKAELNELCSHYDIFICGSDQIWNPKFYDKSYFLDFVNNCAKKIAYAPSFGSAYIPEKLIPSYQKHLASFDAISIREKSGCELTRELTNKNVSYVADPTLLLTSREWKNNFKIQPENKKYILCYFLGENRWYLDIVKRISDLLNIEVMVVGTKGISYQIKNSTVVHPGPIDFVKYLANASFVITDSYHGMLFSVNFNRPFIVLQRFFENNTSSENERLISFMDIWGLQERYYKKNDVINLSCMDILSENIVKKISKFRSKSIEFLVQNIGKE